MKEAFLHRTEATFNMKMSKGTMILVWNASRGIFCRRGIKKLAEIMRNTNKFSNFALGKHGGRMSVMYESQHSMVTALPLITKCYFVQLTLGGHVGREILIDKLT